MWPWDAKEAGVAVMATGRSDFPNQVNNSLGFPGIFRGALDVRARTITDEMCIAAAVEMAALAEEHGLSEDYIMPTMDEVDVFPREAAAVAMKAIEQGVAKFTDVTFEQEYETAKRIIMRARHGAGCHGDRLHCDAAWQPGPQADRNGDAGSRRGRGNVIARIRRRPCTI